MNREDWLQKAWSALIGYGLFRLPANATVKVSCGFPSRHGAARKRFHRSEVIDATLSTGNVYEVFVSPRIDSEIDVAAELLKSGLKIQEGVTQPSGSKKHALAFRNAGVLKPYNPATESEAQKLTDSCRNKLKSAIGTVTTASGNYPHERCDVPETAAKKQGTRLIKVECPDCGVIIRMTRQAMEGGLPYCGRCPIDDETGLPPRMITNESEELETPKE